MSQNRKRFDKATINRNRRLSRDPRLADIGLREGETIIINGIISPGIYWKSLFVLLLALLISLLAWQLGALLLIVSIMMFGVAFLTQRFLLLVLTDHRVIVRYGIMNLETTQIRFSSMESVEVQRTLVGQLLGYASVVLTGTGTRVLIVPFVANANQFRNALDEILFRQDEVK
tara:strand:- start:786 stop:1304 length:519 start_codon:yes stop_codon:yes gene_type:complete